MSKIEQLIGEIEEYIDSCKPTPFSNTKIQVNKEELEELLVELRLRIPDEIKKCQKIISQEDAILNEARGQADAMLADARNQTSELVSEHEIMQQAYAQAQQIVNDAQAQARQTVNDAQTQAQQIVDAAVEEANNVRQSAIDYTDDMLKSLQTIIKHSMDDAGGCFQSLQGSLEASLNIVISNRNELAGSVTPAQEEAGPEQQQ